MNEVGITNQSRFQTVEAQMSRKYNAFANKTGEEMEDGNNSALDDMERGGSRRPQGLLEGHRDFRLCRGIHLNDTAEGDAGAHLF